MIKGVLINVKSDNSISVVEVSSKGLADVYKVLECHLVDVVSARVGKSVVDLIVDDEGLFVEYPIASAQCRNYREQLFGNILIVKHDGRGGWKSLTDEEIEEMHEHILTRVDYEKMQVRPILIYDRA